MHTNSFIYRNDFLFMNPGVSHFLLFISWLDSIGALIFLCLPTVRFVEFQPNAKSQNPGTIPSRIKVTRGEREREKNTQLIVATTFCLPCPRTACATCSDQQKAEDTLISLADTGKIM